MRTLAAPALMVVVFVLAWHVGARLYDQPRVLPTPWAVVAVVHSDGGGLARLSFVSLRRAVAGVALAATAAAILTVVLALFPSSSVLLYPTAVIVKATPAVAFAPILIRILGSGWKVKVAISASIAFFPMLIASLDAVRLIPSELQLLSRAYGVSRWRRLLHVQLGWLLYGFSSGLRTAAPIAVVGAIVAEFVDSSETSELGIGAYLFNASRNDFMPQVFASALMCGFLGLMLFGMCTALARGVASLTHLDE